MTTRKLVLGALVSGVAACAGAGLDRFASPVTPLSGCYAFDYGDWAEAPSPDDGPNPEALPLVVELRTERVGETESESIDGRIHEVRSHGRPGRGILHYWRMVDSDSVVVWTGGPVGFRLDLAVIGQNAAGTVAVVDEGGEDPVRRTTVSGIRTPCPRQGVPG